MVKRIARLFSIALAAAAIAGCGTTAPSRFYTLVPTASPVGTPAADYAVSVGPVTIPALVDCPQIVVQLAPNQVAFDEYNRWAGPLDDIIARTVASDLVVLLGTQRVARSPLANFNPDYRVTIDIQRFESVPGESVLLEAVWAVRGSVQKETRSGRTVAREPMQGKSFDALAAAHSRALAKVSGDIAAAIRAEAGRHP
jgi:uncharacterized protein